jgi:BirA family biotin operon repressor/biotin-[acetyl-CoA-carboxylase] ligase
MTMREQILKIFKESNGTFVSGETLSKALNCSRTTIWKHIEELRNEGYTFEAVRRSGYRLLSAPDTPLPDEIKTDLRTTFLGQEVHYYQTLESTQLVAHSLAKEGAKQGTIVIADQQAGGKGRLGRVWHSPPGTGIWISILLRPQLELHRCPQLTLLAAVAIVQAIREQTGLQAMIKWPNDILINRKKVCGILTELSAESDYINYLIVGIGINVNAPSFPDELRAIATSLRIESNREIKRVPIIQTLLQKFEALYFLYLEEGFSPIKQLWEEYAISIGKRVTIRQVNGSMEGIALGIDHEGVLLVQKDDGSVEKVYSADIEIGASS